MKTRIAVTCCFSILLIQACAYTPRVSHEPQRVSPVPANPPVIITSPAPPKTLPRRINTTQYQSVITDPILLDQPIPDDPTFSDSANDYDPYDDLDSYAAIAAYDDISLNIPEYYDQYRYEYYPVSYTNYGYYPSGTTWWYYDDWTNNAFPYDPYPAYSYYGHSPYDYYSYRYSSRYPHSNRYARGYWQASFWGPVSYYDPNPYWAYNSYGYNHGRIYGWGYYPSFYSHSYGYYPLDYYDDPWFGWHDWHPRHWAYEDPMKPTDDPSTDREKRGTRPMVGERRDQIRLTSSPETDSHSNSGLNSRNRRVETNPRAARNTISRKNNPTVPGLSLPPYRVQNPTSNSAYTRDLKNAQTIRTSRDIAGSNAVNPPKTTVQQESSRSSNGNLSSSNTSIIQKPQTTVPRTISPNRGNTVVLPSSPPKTVSPIRVYSTQPQRTIGGDASIGSSPRASTIPPSRTILPPAARTDSPRSITTTPPSEPRTNPNPIASPARSYSPPVQRSSAPSVSSQSDRSISIPPQAQPRRTSSPPPPNRAPSEPVSRQRSSPPSYSPPASSERTATTPSRSFDSGTPSSPSRSSSPASSPASSPRDSAAPARSTSNPR